MVKVKLYFLVFAVAFCSASLSEPWKEDRREKEKEPKWKNSVIDYVKGCIWPKPQVYNATKIIHSLIPSEFSFASIGETSDVRTEALSRYKSLVFPDPNEKLKVGLQQITKLSVKVEEKYAPQSIKSDESCKLKQYLDYPSEKGKSRRLNITAGFYLQPSTVIIKIQCRIELKWTKINLQLLNKQFITRD